MTSTYLDKLHARWCKFSLFILFRMGLRWSLGRTCAFMQWEENGFFRFWNVMSVTLVCTLVMLEMLRHPALWRSMVRSAVSVVQIICILGSSDTQCWVDVQVTYYKPHLFHSKQLLDRDITNQPTHCQIGPCFQNTQKNTSSHYPRSNGHATLTYLICPGHHYKTKTNVAAKTFLALTSVNNPYQMFSDQSLPKDWLWNQYENAL